MTKVPTMWITLLTMLLGPGPCALPPLAPPLKVAVFVVDVTPPLGSPLCEGAVPPARRVDDRLSCRGLVLFGNEKPIVVCAIDWVGIGNEGYDAWRAALAKAGGTLPDRVAVHCLHQHDAPGYDASAEALLAERRLPGTGFDPAFAKAVIERAARAVREAAREPRPITHLGLGTAEVKEVASNRRVLGADGKVKHVRWSSMPDPKVRAAPEGTIDPLVRVVSLWDAEQPVAALSYYATHPQSHYGKGGVSCDFVGIARRLQEERRPGVTFIHFDGASGNVTAGKYNDGSPDERPRLARRLADGMAAAFNDSLTARTAINASDLGWRVCPVGLPVAPGLAEAELKRRLEESPRFGTARDLAWVQRRQRNVTIDVSALRLGKARVLHLPGELFVEYQLFAQRLRPDLFVAMAAYGDYGPGYIGTRAAYPQGGYETGAPSRVAPDVEDVLVAALRDLLEARADEVGSPSQITATAPQADEAGRR
jgi:hypothetical protein